MAAMADPRELFLHELGDILYAEKTIEKMLPKLAREVRDEQLKERLEQHVEETRQQIKNLEQVFKAMAKTPKAEPCPGIDGIKEEHDHFLESEQPSPEVRELFATAAGARIEHYEIAAYTGLVESAKAMGETDAAALLQENLKGEQEMLKDGVRMARRLKKASAKQMAKASA